MICAVKGGRVRQFSANCAYPRRIQCSVKTVEIVLTFIAAAALVAVVAWVMHLKTRGVLRVIVNSLAGGALIAGLAAFDIIVLPMNLLNAAIIGVLGLPGVGVVVAAAMLL